MYVPRQAEEGKPSKNKTWVGEVMVDDKEGVPLKDSDVIGLGMKVTAGKEDENPYNMIVEGIGEFMVWMRAQLALAAPIKPEEVGNTAVAVKLEDHVSVQPMDVDLNNTANRPIDLTLDSDSDDAVAGPATTTATAKAAAIRLADRPPAWFDRTVEYQWYDRREIPVSHIRFPGQLRSHDSKLGKIPHEFLLAADTQSLVAKLKIQNKMEHGKKVWLSTIRPNEARGVIDAFAKWMETVYLAKVNTDVQEAIRGLGDDAWRDVVCAAADATNEHFAIPNIKGLCGDDEDPMCGLCVMQFLKIGDEAVMAQVAEMRRDYAAEKKAWRVLKDTNVAVGMGFLNFNEVNCEQMYNSVMEETERARLNTPARPYNRPAAAHAPHRYNDGNKAYPSPVGMYGRAMNANKNRKVVNTKAKTNSDNGFDGHDTSLGRSVSLLKNKPVFAVEVGEPSLPRTCLQCAADIPTEERGFRISSEGLVTKWYHTRCVSERVRKRALTEGVSGWSKMDDGERVRVVRALVGGGEE